MAILDINKNSLPEQVQENKENIAAIQTAMNDKASIDYVDEKDADTLQDAKDYTDDEIAGVIPKSIFTKPGSLITSDNDNNPKEFKTDGYPHGYIVTNADGLGHNGFAVQGNIPVSDIDAIATAGKVLTADGHYGCNWQDPSIKAANVDSETATAGKVLTADGNGAAAWVSPSGGNGWTLVWSGSMTLANGTQIPATLEYGKRYVFEFSVVNENRICYTNIVNRFNGAATNVFALTTANSSIMAITFDISTLLIYSNVQKYDINGSAVTNTVVISAIYEV